MSENGMPKTAEDFYDRAFEYFGEDDDKAIADSTQAIRLDPNHDSAYSLRGQIYFTKGDFDRAIADHNEAIRINPDFAGYYCQRGRAYKAKGDRDRALKDFNKAEEITPGVTTGY